MRTAKLVIGSCVLVSLALGTSVTWSASVTDFIDFSSPLVPGRLYVPPEAADLSVPRPLILFLHGAGETGSNNAAQINGNIDNLLAGAKQRGAFLYAPQATTYSWGDLTRTTTVMSMIDQALLNFNVAADRLYVTGLSMGGGGVWNMLSRFADRFAAGVPIAAVSPAGDFQAANLVGKPAWPFHARNDTVVSPLASRNVVSAILSAAAAAPVTYPATTDPATTMLYTNGPVGLNYTEWSLGGHGIWGQVYGLPAMYDWMFSKSLTPPVPVEPSGGGQIITNNTSSIFPIGNQDGLAIPAGTGFVAVGTFDLPDSVISATTAGGLGLLTQAFTQFGSSLPVGANRLEGLFSANIGAPLAADSPLIGKNIYLVVGDGENIEDSSSLFVFKSFQEFDLAGQTFQASVALSNALNMGDILLGSLGTVYDNRFGYRPGIVAAAVDIPEPATILLLTIGSVLLPRMPRVSRSATTRRLCDAGETMPQPPSQPTSAG